MQLVCSFKKKSRKSNFFHASSNVEIIFARLIITTNTDKEKKKANRRIEFWHADVNLLVKIYNSQSSRNSSRTNIVFHPVYNTCPAISATFTCICSKGLRLCFLCREKGGLRVLAVWNFLKAFRPPPPSMPHHPIIQYKMSNQKVYKVWTPFTHILK